MGEGCKSVLKLMGEVKHLGIYADPCGVGIWGLSQASVIILCPKREISWHAHLATGIKCSARLRPLVGKPELARPAGEFLLLFASDIHGARCALRSYRRHDLFVNVCKPVTRSSAIIT
jgi:hypothetical protein